MAKPQIKMGACITDYHQVKVAPNAMLSPHCTIVGNVTIGGDSAVLAGAHVRGDCEPIVIGSQTNIQENCCLHVSVGSKLTVGDHVIIGHNATLHGCTIEDNVLVGMDSTVMDDAVIGTNCVVGAGSLVTQGKVFEPGMLLMGRPARAVRKLTDEEIDMLITTAADAYVEVAHHMAMDGLLLKPQVGTNIWPMPNMFGNAVGAGMIFGAAF